VRKFQEFSRCDNNERFRKIIRTDTRFVQSGRLWRRSNRSRNTAVIDSIGPLRVTLIFWLATGFWRDSGVRWFPTKPVLTSISGMSRRVSSQPSFPPSSVPSRPSLTTRRPTTTCLTLAIDSVTIADAGPSVSLAFLVVIARLRKREENRQRFDVRNSPDFLSESHIWINPGWSASESMKHPARKPVRKEFRSSVSSRYRRRSIGRRYETNGGSRVSPASCRLLPKLISREVTILSRDFTTGGGGGGGGEQKRGGFRGFARVCFVYCQN